MDICEHCKISCQLFLSLSMCLKYLKYVYFSSESHLQYACRLFAYKKNCILFYKDHGLFVEFVWTKLQGTYGA